MNKEAYALGYAIGFEKKAGLLGSKGLLAAIAKRRGRGQMTGDPRRAGRQLRGIKSQAPVVKPTVVSGVTLTPDQLAKYKTYAGNPRLQQIYIENLRKYPRQTA